MAKATSISAENLTKFTRAAVKAATEGVPGKFVFKASTIGYILAQELEGVRSLNLAEAITTAVAANAKSAGISGIRPKPVVVRRPGNITIGFIADELGVTIRGL